MDFYAQQEAARRKSIWLTSVALLFAALVVAATGFVFTVAAWGVCVVLKDGGRLPGYARFMELHPNVNPAAYLLGFVVVLFSGLWSYCRIGSGAAVMRIVGARKARHDEDQTLVNVVEEMSIASGADMPSVWVLEADDGVNAFAAGRGEGDSAVCVSAGALKYLVRDELQGVVAHEFGHILNGDMRLNTHLVALVEGLGGIAGLGRGMLWPVRKLIAKLFRPDEDDDGSGWSWRGGGGGRGSGGGGAPGCGPAILLAGVYILTGCALWVLGLVGVFFARILQRAVRGKAASPSPSAASVSQGGAAVERGRGGRCDGCGLWRASCGGVCACAKEACADVQGVSGVGTAMRRGQRVRGRPGRAPLALLAGQARASDGASRRHCGGRGRNGRRGELPCRHSRCARRGLAGLTATPFLRARLPGDCNFPPTAHAAIMV